MTEPPREDKLSTANPTDLFQQLAQLIQQQLKPMQDRIEAIDRKVNQFPNKGSDPTRSMPGPQDPTNASRRSGSVITWAQTDIEHMIPNYEEDAFNLMYAPPFEDNMQDICDYHNLPRGEEAQARQQQDIDNQKHMATEEFMSEEGLSPEE